MEPPPAHPSCLRCVTLEREVHRLKAQARRDLDDLEELRSDNRSLSRAVRRQRLQLDDLEDQVAALTPEENR